MGLDIVKENLCVHKQVGVKKEIIFVEGDMIVPDAKPDILNMICTSGVAYIYKKEVADEKVKIEGNINTYIMYLADDEKDKVRGLNTSLDFSEIIQMPNAQEGMSSEINSLVKSIECRVINGRKIGIKVALELEIKVFSNEEVEIINDIQEQNEIQILKESLTVNSLVGTGETKIYAKDTLSIDNIDNLAEILKVNVNLTNRDVKVSYNKILTKAEAEIRIMYLTEDNRINTVTGKIPIVGFIDIPGVTENNLSNTNYEIRNLVIKPNSQEEHSIYVELEVGVTATVFEEKQINIIQDLYSPSYVLEFNKKNITVMTKRNQRTEMKQIREKVHLDGLENRTIIDVDVNPFIEKENKLNDKITYEGELQLQFILSNQDLQVDTRIAKIPFEFVMENLEDAENLNSNMNIEILNKDFVISEGGEVLANIDMNMNLDTSKTANLNLIDEIETNGEREEEDYSIIMYVVKKGDTLWKIAKKYGSTIDDIVRTNGIENPDKIYPGEKLYIPKYKRKVEMANYAS